MKQELDRNQESRIAKVEVSLNQNTDGRKMNSQGTEINVDYKYTGEWSLYAGILGSEEELNNYKRWETHEGNTEITGVTKYAD